MFEELLRTAEVLRQPAWLLPYLEAEHNARQLRCYSRRRCRACSRPSATPARWLSRWETVRNEALSGRQSIERMKDVVKPWI